MLFASLLALASLAVAAPLEKRATVLASGNGMKSGAISKTLSWQSSGKLVQGGCPSAVKISVSSRFISGCSDQIDFPRLILQSCYQVLLNSAGNLASRSVAEDSIFADSDDSHHQTTLSDAYYAEASPFLAPADVGGPEFEEITVQEESSALVKRASARQRIELYSMPLASSVSQILFESYDKLQQILGQNKPRKGAAADPSLPFLCAGLDLDFHLEILPLHRHLNLG